MVVTLVLNDEMTKYTSIVGKLRTSETSLINGVHNEELLYYFTTLKDCCDYSLHVHG